MQTTFPQNPTTVQLLFAKLRDLLFASWIDYFYCMFGRTCYTNSSLSWRSCIVGHIRTFNIFMCMTNFGGLVLNLVKASCTDGTLCHILCPVSAHKHKTSINNKLSSKNRCPSKSGKVAYRLTVDWSEWHSSMVTLIWNETLDLRMGFAHC